jgi:peptidoglycan/xylan/chitin deacetylase (PgdA/CDA1 family)
LRGVLRPARPARGLALLAASFVLLLLLLALGAPRAAAQSSPCEDDPTACLTSAPAPGLSVTLGPWTRSMVCPVLYTHEVPSPAMLRRVLVALIATGYHPTSLASVDAAMAGAADRPPGCLVLTFDDALYSQYQNALPVLTELGVPGVFFALPAFADGVHRYMGVPELQALAAAGEEVEAHTCNHPNLPMLARLNLNAFLAEVQGCKQQLETLIGAPVNYFAYPFGAYDATVLDAVARAGFRAAFTTRASALLSAGTPYALPRIRYDPAEAPLAIVRRLRGAGG